MAAASAAMACGGSDSSYGLYGYSNTGVDLFARCANKNSYVAILNGDVNITGRLHKAGGSFKIDHPLDPENKYLYHSFVESPDMKNVYDGVVVLDAAGEALVPLPDWFEAL